MAYPKRVNFEAVRTVAFGSVGAAYAAVGAVTTTPIRVICFTNNTDADVYFSLDGTTNHVIVPASGFKLFDLTTNKVRDDGLFIREGLIFYVKRVAGAPTTGNVYIECMYAD